MKPAMLRVRPHSVRDPAFKDNRTGGGLPGPRAVKTVSPGALGPCLPHQENGHIAHPMSQVPTCSGCRIRRNTGWKPGDHLFCGRAVLDSLRLGK